MAVNQNVTQLTPQAGSANTSSLLYAVTGGTTDTSLPLSVLFNAPAFTGVPTVPTAAVNTNTTQIASTAYVIGQGYLTAATATATYAPIASPTFSGTVVIPTVTLTGGTINSTPIGATTPSTGAFSTLSATGAISGSGFTNFLASPSAIGSTAASTGKFTTLQTTGAYTPSTTAGIVGTTLADNATVGSVGEYITATGTAVALTSGVSANITSISLSPGDWDVWGNVVFNPAGTTVISTESVWINTVSATLPASPLFSNLFGITLAAGAAVSLTAPMQRINVSTTTTVYLSTNVTFSVSTCTATGIINARRRR